MGRNVEFNKDETVKKAMNVFWEKGYNGASMQDLVDAMQINRSSLYNTIGDKQQLFLECIGNYVDELMCETMQKVNREQSPLQGLVNLIRDKAEWIVDCEKGCLGMKTIFEIAPNDTEVRNLMSRQNDVFLEFLAGVIQRAIDAGEISDEEDPALLAEQITMSFTGWKQSYILHGNPIKIKKLAEYMIRNITRK